MKNVTTVTHLFRGATGALLIALILAGCDQAGPAGVEDPPALRDGVESAARNADVVPGRFIVTLRADANAAAVAQEHGVRPDFTYGSALNGFAGAIADAARAGLLRDGRVLRVEPDQVVRVIPIVADGSHSTVQDGINFAWGLDRIDQRAGLNEIYNYDNTGSGVVAFILDTGIRSTHNEFGNRVVRGYDAFGGDTEDCYGHGTHVAGTVGGANYGVAKAVTLVAVRVLNCNGSGTLSGVIAGIDWVTDEVGSGGAYAGQPAVANMSLGGGASSSLDAAVSNSIAAGVTYAVAAGNGNRGGKEQDACGYSPARVPEALTIGATGQNDDKASFSNYGSCVDWFAPGVAIGSAIDDCNDCSARYSGTSMAAPHVAGVAALYLENHASASPAEVRDALYSFTTKGIVGDALTADNHLLYSFETVDAGGGGGDEPDPEPDPEPEPCTPRGNSGNCF